MNWIKIGFGIASLAVGTKWFIHLLTPAQRARLRADWFLPKDNYVKEMSNATGLIILGIGLIILGLTDSE
ncbi:hypothetical protein GCM10011375_39020 [Hymenobacter qilianensis]|uniref:Uncharacterized protein n=2 Tax=Hymenobacter qilianensis TaxID=1385715 RepID=A0A7H0H194_9BACT|nr:hypothetical protein [Hymenobacter qilianensis]QNP54310.1 hypothetical protein H9L05_20990 [Hymenobacter qilianensis]GGF80135.1 hypothetical protein GCM10011375_39020 [Hymenobacter qilianensis]